MNNTNHKQFRHSAQTKKDAACYLMIEDPGHPAPAAYLSHVTLECALKLRILRYNKAQHTDDLKKKIPVAIFEALFNGTTGHDLHHLAKTAVMDRFLAASGNENLLRQPEWKAMSGQRPYSLRYGSESISAADAKRQVKFAAKLTDLILKNVV